MDGVIDYVADPKTPVATYRPLLLQSSNLQILESTAALGNYSWTFKACQLEDVLSEIAEDIAITLSKSHGAVWIGVQCYCLGNTRKEIPNIK